MAAAALRVLFPMRGHLPLALVADIPPGRLCAPAGEPPALGTGKLTLLRENVFEIGYALFDGFRRGVV